MLKHDREYIDYDELGQKAAEDVECASVAETASEEVVDGGQKPPTSIDTATGKEAEPELSSERVKEIFSTISKKYERFNAVSSFGAYKLWLADVVKKAPITPESDVLDIAGGTGDVAFAIARGKHPKHIQCTDLVNDMLDVARAHYAEGAADGVPVDFEVVDAQNIPYADNSYDVITVAYGLRNMPQREKALSEMYRVLKPGGTLVCLEFSQPANPAWHAMYDFYLTHMIPFWGGLITGDRDGFVKLLFGEDDTLLGAHMVGQNVTEMIAEPTLARMLGATAHRIARTIHAHPTMNEGVMEAAEAALGEAIHL